MPVCNAFAIMWKLYNYLIKQNCVGEGYFENLLLDNKSMKASLLAWKKNNNKVKKVINKVKNQQGKK